MTKSSTMETLINLAAEEVEKAAVMLGHTIKAGAEAEQKLSMLLQYREDYVVRFQENRKMGLSVADYRNYSLFIDKLDEAISGQQQVVREAQGRIDAAKAAWQDCEKKRASYEILQERALEKERKKAARREQKESDEFNSRRARMVKLG